jgi:hypothetical protein
MVWWAIGFAVVLASGVYLTTGGLSRHFRNRVYVIGWQNSPPFQERAADGSPAGLVVDLVRDSAQRRGIRLKWAWHPEGPDAALRSKQIDLWPLITITPERRGVIHISKPYLKHDYDLLVRADSPYIQVQDLRDASVTYLSMPIHKRFLERMLPHARLVAARMRSTTCAPDERMRPSWTSSPQAPLSSTAAFAGTNRCARFRPRRFKRIWELVQLSKQAQLQTRSGWASTRRYSTATCSAF